MKQKAVPATRRGRALPDEDFPPDFVRRAYMLAIRRAARDVHRAVCDRDAAECPNCQEHASAIAAAKWMLNHGREST